MDGKREERKGQKRLGAQEGHELARRWRASGLIASEYCRRYRVNLHVLRYWAGRSKRTEPTDEGSGFFVVTAPPKPEPNHEAGLEGSTRDDSSRAVLIVVPLRRGAVTLTEALRAVFAEELR
jgi:hypothetical protein